jgi:uncharacterized membrane protein YbaN (DUF454 family)
MRTYIYITLGWLCIFIGILGTVLPILQGLLLIGVGVLLLSRHSPRVRRMLATLKRRYPGIMQYIERGKRRAGEMFEFAQRDQ